MSDTNFSPAKPEILNTPNATYWQHESLRAQAVREAELQAEEEGAPEL
jgi:hypothetical protein